MPGMSGNTRGTITRNASQVGQPVPDEKGLEEDPMCRVFARKTQIDHGVTHGVTYLLQRTYFPFQLGARHERHMW